MILMAYACLIIAVTAYVRGFMGPVLQRVQTLARVLGALAAIGFASVGLLLLGNGAPGVVGASLLFMLVFGAVMYVWGLLRWHASDGFVLRHTGWLLLVAALAFPTTLTLLLPIACLLVPTLRSTPEPHTVARIQSPVGR
jgi:hypothetical protein